MRLEKRREYEEKKFKVMNLRQNVALRKRDDWGENTRSAQWCSWYVYWYAGLLAA